MKLSRPDVVVALREAKGCVRDAALALGVTRQAVYDAVERYGIRRRQPAADISEKRRRAAYARWERRLKQTA